MDAHGGAPGPIERLERTLRSPLARLLAIAGLTLVLQVPVLLVGDLVRERRSTRDAAVEEMGSTWGGAQRLAGPFLVVPYRVPSEDADRPPAEAVATFLAAELTVAADLRTERLRRGLFEAPVYRAVIVLSGTFDPPDFAQWAVPSHEVLWERAELAFDVSGVRSIQTGARLRWGETDLDFEPGTGLRGGGTGIHVRVGGPDQGRGDLTFQATLELAGSAGLRVAPTGKSTAVDITGNWPHPSFRGAWLPAKRELHEDGFSAAWHISYLGRGYPQSWRGTAYGMETETATVGVDLLTPVDPYRQSERTLKYSLLFLALTFGVAWLFEVLGGARLHLVHYALIGAAMCLFYLLELALSEHVGFPAAYALAAALVVVTNGAYARSLLAPRRAALLAGVLCVLYGGIYVLLQLDDHALLAGAGALFLILAAIMYATRAIDWHAAGSKPARAGGGTR